MSLQLRKGLCQCWTQNWTWKCGLRNCAGRTCSLYCRYLPEKGHIYIQTCWPSKPVCDQNGATWSSLGHKSEYTRLKECLLAQLPGLRAQSKGWDVVLAFNDNIAEALGKACEQDCDSELVYLARAAQIIRRYMFEEANLITGSCKEACQQEAVPPVLRALVDMVLHGSNIKIQMDGPSTQTASSIAQLLKFNGVNHRQQQKRSTSPAGTKTQKHPAVRHATSQETCVPVYTGLMLHAETRKRGLVDKLFSLGLSISYDCVLCLSAEMGNRACQLFQAEQVVCLPTMHGSVFMTAAVDNINHNPSSTTAKDSFHGTGISRATANVCRWRSRVWDCHH